MITEISIEDWPVELTFEAAMIGQDPKELADIAHLAFAERFDDLDIYSAAVFKINGHGPYALKRYRNCPTSGTSVFIRTGLNQPMKELELLINALKLEVSDLKWVHPSIQQIGPGRGTSDER